MLPKSSTGELIYAYGYDIILRLSGTPLIVAHAARATATIQGLDIIIGGSAIAVIGLVSRLLQGSCSVMIHWSLKASGSSKTTLQMLSATVERNLIC
jgi:hypothetical protein